MLKISELMPKLNFLSYVAKVDPAFARALEIGIYMTITYVALGLLQGSFNFDIQTIGSMVIAPTLVLIAKRKRDLEKELIQFKFDLENTTDSSNPLNTPIKTPIKIDLESDNLNNILTDTKE